MDGTGMYGWDPVQVEALKSTVQAQFDTLAGKTDILNDIISTVRSVWVGPDAEAYLQTLVNSYNNLVTQVETCYDQLLATETGIFDVINATWTKYQESGTTSGE